jgi:hypothetical protein
MGQQGIGDRQARAFGQCQIQQQQIRWGLGRALLQGFGLRCGCPNHLNAWHCIHQGA